MAGAINLKDITKRFEKAGDAVAGTLAVDGVSLEVGELEPDHIHVPGIYVNRIVRIPADGL